MDAAAPLISIASDTEIKRAPAGVKICQEFCEVKRPRWPWKQKLEKRCCNVANKVRDEETCAMDAGGVTGHCADAVDED